MNKPTHIPESIRAAMSRGGKARAARYSTEERQANGRKAWATRLARALEQEKGKT